MCWCNSNPLLQPHSYSHTHTMIELVLQLPPLLNGFLPTVHHPCGSYELHPSPPILHYQKWSRCTFWVPKAHEIHKHTNLNLIVSALGVDMVRNYACEIRDDFWVYEMIWICACIVCVCGILMDLPECVLSLHSSQVFISTANWCIKKVKVCRSLGHPAST